MELGPPVPLERHHDTTEFDCDDDSLNRWLRDYAKQNAKKDMSRTFVVVEENSTVVRAYYAITPGQVNIDQIEPSFLKGLPKHPIPAIVIARLAVDTSFKGMGLGEAILKDALKRAASAADNIGGRLLIVHAIDERAKAFYKKYGFLDLPEESGDGLTLFAYMKDIRVSIAEALTTQAAI